MGVKPPQTDYDPPGQWERYSPPQRRTPLLFSLLQGLAGMFSGGVIILAMLAGIGLWRSGEDFVNAVKTAFTLPEPEETVNVQTVVVEQIRGASELTTAIFSMEAVVPTTSSRTVANYEVGKTTLIYIAYGEVRAGVDLSALAPEDIQPSGAALRVVLPPPTILDSKIDVTRSQVFDYDRGFLGLGPDRAPELQDKAQEVALQKLLLAACQQGILQQASDRAELVVGQLLQSSGFEQVVIESRPSPNTACAEAGTNTVQ